jgi:4-amino-4-deoxy-L-arabinose transferase-like glycosyltransferase
VAGLVIGGFYSMNAYDLLFWLGAYYLLLRIARRGEGTGWIGLGLVLGLGLLNKVGLVVFGAALSLGLLVTRHRSHLADRRLYGAGLVAAGLVTPYVLWNASHGWATLQFIENARSQKIVALSPLQFLGENILEANPVTLPLWLGGLAWLLLAREARRYRLVAVMFVATFVILVVQKGKPYYFASSFPILMAAGGVAWEGWTRHRPWPWVRWAWLFALLVGGGLLAPIAVPLLSPEGTVAYAQRLGIVPAAQEIGHTTALPQHFSDRLGWENLARVVSGVYRGLPPDQRSGCVAIGRNYGHAAALEYWSRRYELPPVYSTHNNYWFWGPPSRSAAVFILVGGRREEVERLFAEIREAGVAESPRAQESHLTVWVGRGLRRPIGDVWRDYKAFI